MNSINKEAILINTIFIQEADKLNCITRIFNIAKFKQNVITVPVKNIKNLKPKKIIKITKKIVKKLNKYKIDAVVLSKDLQENEDIVRILHSNNISIFDGRWLFNCISYEIIEYILKKKKLKIQNSEITILANDVTPLVIGNIRLFANKFKRVNIVTNHVSRFKNIEKELYNNMGIMMTITNNKRKSLSNSKIILNFDFVTENINKYTIYDNAIIVNLEENVKIEKKRFNGININNYEIKIKDFKVDCINQDKFYVKDLFESYIYNLTTFENIRKNLSENEISIKKLIGKNGTINL